MRAAGELQDLPKGLGASGAVAGYSVVGKSQRCSLDENKSVSSFDIVC